MSGDENDREVNVRRGELALQIETASPRQSHVEHQAGGCIRARAVQEVRHRRQRLFSDQLIDALMRAAIEYAGAERGLLVLPRREEYWIEAEATTGSGAVSVSMRKAKITAADLPESVLRYAARTKDSVLLLDALDANPFSADEYLRAHHPRSILCLPLLKQTGLIGAIYLENNLTSSALAPARIAVIKLLATEAAMSLENLHLYSDIQDRDAKTRRIIDSALDACELLSCRGHTSV